MKFAGMELLRDLVEAYRPLKGELRSIYARVPATTCKGKASCCTLFPDLILAEALSAIEIIIGMGGKQRRKVFERTALYFYLNPVRIMSCPFLEEKRCTIYEYRFAGCRTYGLWSKRHYEKMAAKSLEAKRRLQDLWKQAGVLLPSEVTEFHVPYCDSVRVVCGPSPDDSALMKVGGGAALLSEQISQEMHLRFIREFYMDFSFFMVSLATGMQVAVNDKFRAVRSVCAGHGSGIAKKRAEDVADILDDLFCRL